MRALRVKWAIAEDALFPRECVEWRPLPVGTIRVGMEYRFGTVLHWDVPTLTALVHSEGRIVKIPVDAIEIIGESNDE